MAPLDMGAGLPDIEADAPAGPNLELDAEFGALERTAQGTPERQAGDKVIAAEDPVWKDVAAGAAALLERTYDLRLLVHLAVARLHMGGATGGLPGFAEVLATTAGLMEQRWEHVHPQLDPEDDNDPMFRANALLPLTHPTRVLKLLRNLPLAASQRAGVVTWRTIAVSLGTLETEDAAEKQTEAEIRAAFIDTPSEKVETLRVTIAAALRALAAIGGVFDTQCGYGKGPNLDTLLKQLQEMDRYIGLYYAPGIVADDAPEQLSAESDGVSDAGTVVAPARASGVVTAKALKSIATRDEAMHLLDIVCSYYEQHEPSSPLPLMIGRVRKLADKSFLEILQDLAPDGLGQAQVIVQSREASSY